MSSKRLTRLHDEMQGLVDDGRLAGITTMIARHGTVVDFQTYGHRDIEAGDPMEEDEIFRIYSMSKPITGVALMTLYEEGKFRLSDPVARYIPEFAGLQVAFCCRHRIAPEPAGLAGWFAAQGDAGDRYAQFEPDQVIGLPQRRIAAARIRDQAIFVETGGDVVARRFEHHVNPPAQITGDVAAVALLR